MRTVIVTTPADDLRERMAPTREQIRVAAAMLAAAPEDVTGVVVPLAFPGKRHGVWVSGQAVEHPAGYWLTDCRSWDGPHAHAAARDAAEQAATVHLGDRDGTPGYAVIRLGGTWAVFEGFKPA